MLMRILSINLAARADKHRNCKVLPSGFNTSVSYYVNLNLNTSFTGRDLLVTQLAVGNGNSPANELVSSGFFNSWGVPFTDQGAGTPNNVVVRELFYSFHIGDAVQVDIGPRLNYYR